MILERPMAFSSGFESYLDNIGEMRNSGWEITLNGMLIKRPDMRWDVTVMASTQSNKVLKLTPETPEIIDGSTIIREGPCKENFRWCILISRAPVAEAVHWKKISITIAAW